MSNELHDELLKRMPAIAEAVNLFKSESIQQQVFKLLLAALQKEVGLPDVPQESEQHAEEKERNVKHAASSDAAKAAKTKGPRKARPSGPPKLLPNLNLRPAGKNSLKQFVEEKRPETNEERIAVMIHYLQHSLGLTNLTRDHVYSCFKEIGVKSPTEIDAALRMTAHRKGWIDTSNSADLKVTISGENFVEHDLPRKKAEKGNDESTGG